MIGGMAVLGALLAGLADAAELEGSVERARGGVVDEHGSHATWDELRNRLPKNRTKRGGQALTFLGVIGGGTLLQVQGLQVLGAETDAQKDRLGTVMLGTAATSVTAIVVGTAIQRKLNRDHFLASAQREATRRAEATALAAARVPDPLAKKELLTMSPAVPPIMETSAQGKQCGLYFRGPSERLPASAPSEDKEALDATCQLLVKMSDPTDTQEDGHQWRGALSAVGWSGGVSPGCAEAARAVAIAPEHLIGPMLASPDGCPALRTAAGPSPSVNEVKDWVQSVWDPVVERARPHLVPSERGFLEDVWPLGQQ